MSDSTDQTEPLAAPASPEQLAAEQAQISQAAAERLARETAAEKPAEPRKYYVIDTSATAEHSSRTHEMLIDGAIVQVTFNYGVAKELPLALATKFLKHDTFKLTDANGRILNYKRVPRQPDDLGAGERFKIGEDETIARFDELLPSALLQRALELPGGEKFASGITADQRPAVIEFIKGTVAKLKKANQSKEADIGADDFVPQFSEED